MIHIKQARKLYEQSQAGSAKIGQVFALDSITIDLCLSLFLWAHFLHGKGSIKMHTIMDLHGSIPVFIHITNSRVHDEHSGQDPDSGSFTKVGE